MLFREIDDVLWESMEPSLPSQKPHTGRLCANMKKLMNGILYVVMTRLYVKRRSQEIRI
ncbi:hypothetical protein [Methanosarcina sp.]|uniref:hypothetical protein n=1 Tax=Methanosarcina sp. TaxID=2213 RepID=UPI00298849BE|nr:hypothetical protein [Methanosarcina sp.]MDW5550966.1 hypothetical protein [Methanosarcina sp.]MDW5556020.1 hypothetical protein [Methanosarcina sp.]